MYALFRIGYVSGYKMEGWMRRVERGNYDKDILNEVGSKNNPIDLTKEDGYETEKQDEEELTEDEKKKKSEFVKEKEKEIAEIMSNLKRQIPEDEDEDDDEEADKKMFLVSEKMEELKKEYPDWSEDKIYDTAYDYVHIHSNCEEEESYEIEI